MYTTANLALTSWDQPQDDFDHTQLDANWRAIDQHDHSLGRGVQIGTAGIQAQSITSGLIADEAIGNAQLATNAVGTANIQPGAITNALLASGGVTSSDIAPGSITFGNLDPNIIPLGMVTLWYRGPGSSSTPGGGWEIMDGRPWSSIANLLGLSTGNIPDMRGAFSQGADLAAIAGPAIGATGGSNTASLAHAHGVNQHSHTVPVHTHAITDDGSHLHTWQGGLHMATRTNCLPIGMTVQGAFGGNAQDTFYSMYIQNLLSNPAWLQVLPNGTVDQEIDGPADMDNAGLHSHGGFTQGNGSLSTGNAGATTDSQLGSVATVPRYVGLLYIMRCR